MRFILKVKRCNSCRHSKENYPSAEFLFNIMYLNYEKERERGNTFDIKAGVFFTAVIALLGFYMQVFPFENVKDVYIKMTPDVVITTILLCLMTMALVCILVAFILFSLVMISKVYKNVDLCTIDSEENNLTEKDEMARAMTSHYLKIVQHNIKVNNQKSRLYTVAIVFMLVSVVLFTLAIVGLNFV